MFCLFSFLIFSFSIIVQVQCAAFGDPCTTDSDCGTHNNVCVQGSCGCPTLSMMYSKFDANHSSIVDYACPKPCQSSDDCDSSNNEECLEGSCECKSPYARYMSLKCIDPTKDPGCPPPQNIYPSLCDNSWGISCDPYGMTPYHATCLNSGFCCIDWTSQSDAMALNKK